MKKFSFAVVEVLDSWHLLFPFSRFYHWCHLRKKIIVFTYLLHTYINQNLSAMTVVNSFTTMWYTLGDILVLTKMREFLQSYKKPKLLWNWLLDTIVNYSWQRSGGRLRRGHMSDLIKKICFCTADFSKDLFLPRHRKKLDWKVKSVLTYKWNE